MRTCMLTTLTEQHCIKTSQGIITVAVAEPDVNASNILEGSSLNLILVITAVVTAVDSTQDNSCNACNCQFNNIQVLEQLIDGNIAGKIG